jgi:hypothetical protein
LLTLCGAFDLVICNGMTRWEKFGNFTCNTYNGASVVDYAICSHNLCGKMEEVLEKEDPNKQFFWLKISENGNHIRIVACYFAPQVSKIYNSRGLDHKDPFAALKTDIAIYSQLGEVLIVGDFNARTIGEQASIFCCKEDGDPI